MSTTVDPGTKGRILVVDDDASLSEMLSLVLRQEGFESRLVDRGDDALAAFHDYKPDLVLLDLGLPRVDGCTVARQMRSDSRMNGVTLVALTGYGSDEDKVRVRDAGFDYHLLKPVTMRTLETLLESPGRASSPSGGRPTPIGQ